MTAGLRVSGLTPESLSDSTSGSSGVIVIDVQNAASGRGRGAGGRHHQGDQPPGRRTVKDYSEALKKINKDALSPVHLA